MSERAGCRSSRSKVLSKGLRLRYGRWRMGARDNFSSAVVRLLADRAGHRCSNPACGCPTIGPSLRPDRAVNLGVAAHITAASAGGPRYDAALAVEHRKSAENGI